MLLFRYPKLKELGLKWFAVPGVSNMAMDCGATALNGWYMPSKTIP